MSGKPIPYIDSVDLSKEDENFYYACLLILWKPHRKDTLFHETESNKYQWEQYLITISDTLKIHISNFINCHNSYYKSKILSKSLKQDSIEDKLLNDHPCEETHEAYTFNMNTDMTGNDVNAGFFDTYDFCDITEKNESMDEHNATTTSGMHGLNDAIKASGQIPSVAKSYIPPPDEFMKNPDIYYQDKAEQLDNYDDEFISYGTQEFLGFTNSHQSDTNLTGTGLHWAH